MKKRIFSFLLALLMVVSILPVQSFAEGDTTQTPCDVCGQTVCICNDGENVSNSMEIPDCSGAPTCWGETNALPMNNHVDGCARKDYLKNLVTENDAQSIAAQWSSFTEKEQADIMTMVEAYTSYGDTLKELVNWGGSKEPTEPGVTEPEVTDPEATDPEVTEPEEDVPSISTTITDSEGNVQTITVSGTSLPEGATLTVTATKPVLTADGYKKTRDYDISLWLDGEKYEPTSAVKVTFTGLDVYDYSFAKLVHYMEDPEAIAAGQKTGAVLVYNDAELAAAYPAASAAAYEVLGENNTVCVELFYSTNGQVEVSEGTVSFYATSFSIYTLTTTGSDSATGRLYAVYDDDNGTAQNSNGYSETHEITMDDSNGATFMLTRGQKFYLDIGPTFFVTGMTSYRWYLSESTLGSLDTSGFGTLLGNDTILTVSSSAPHYTKYTITVIGYNVWGENKNERTINVYVVPEVQLIFNANVPSGASTSGLTVPTSRKTVLGDGTSTVPYTRVQVSNPTGTIAGYTFAGWYTATSGGTKLSSGTYVFLDNDTATYIGGTYSDQYQMNLYAQWNTTITYDANGGSAVSNKTYNINSDPDPVIGSTSRSGYTFFGWYSSGDGKIYQAGNTYSADKPTTMTALWGKQASSTSGWRNTFYILSGTTSGSFADELEYIDVDHVSNNITGDANVYYVAPGTTIALAHDSGLWRIDGAKSGLTLKAGSTTVGTGWSSAATNATLTVSAAAAEGTTMMIYVRDAENPAVVSCAKIIIDKPSDITVNANNDTQNIYKVGVYIICDSRDIPGEPKYTENVNMINIAGQNYKQTGAGTVLDGIATSAHYISSLDGSCTMGVVDYTGHETIPYMNAGLLADAMDRIIDELKKTDGETLYAADGTNLNEFYQAYGETAVRENFAVRPHIVKLMTGLDFGNLGWHIDCSIYAMNTITLTYNLNPPEGYVLKDLGTPDPEVAKMDVDAVDVRVTSDIAVNNQYTATVSGATDAAELTFTGWNTKPDGTGTSYAPGSTIAIAENTTLYAQWTGGNFTTGTLEVYKNVTVTENSVAPGADTFTFTINLSGSYGYNIYNSTSGALVSTGTMTNGTFTLKAGQFIRFTGVPVATYAIQENLPAHYSNSNASQSVTIKGGAINQAIFTNVYSNIPAYTVTWINEDGTVLEKDTGVKRGEIPTYNGITPAKAATAEYTYAFSGWSPAVSAVTGDVTYKATYTATKNKYTVTWVNEDGTVLETDENVEYGTIPDYNGATPTKESTAQFNYTFRAWSPAVETVKGNVTYTASFTPEERSYDVVWVNEDGTALETDKDVLYGTMPEYNGSTPTKEGDAQFNYTFAGWSPEVVSVTGKAIYTATFTQSIKDYTVVWKNYDGTVLETDQNVPYGTMPSYDGTDPSRVPDETYTYTWTGWNSVVTPVTGDVTYTAIYSMTYIDYTVVFKDEDGSVISTKIYHYGEQIVVPADPSKNSDSKYTYTFKGWTPGVHETCAGDAVYTAQYEGTAITCIISYVAGEGGTVSATNSETWGSTVSETIWVGADTAAGAIAKPDVGYKFIGWYLGDEKVSGNINFIPEKASNGMYAASEYTAKFELALVDLTITASGNDSNQSYIFEITGQPSDGSAEVRLQVVLSSENEFRVTIRDLPVGNYRVEEVSDWSWRQNDVDSRDVLLDESKTLGFDFGAVERIYWLSGCSYGKRKKGGSN